WLALREKRKRGCPARESRKMAASCRRRAAWQFLAARTCSTTRELQHYAASHPSSRPSCRLRTGRLPSLRQPMRGKPALTAALSGLLQACKESPEDNAPRLILADWLEEHGDSDRAEFIRLQLAREGRDWLDPVLGPIDGRLHELRPAEEGWLGGSHVRPLM